MRSKRVPQFYFCSPYVIAGLLFYCATYLFRLNNFYEGENIKNVLSFLVECLQL